MAKLAKSFEVTEDNKVLIDGKEFPWFVAEEQIETVSDVHFNISTVRFSILAESVKLRKGG